MNEPIFEYDFPAPYQPPERYFPLRQAFNLYLDRYRDQKQVMQTIHHVNVGDEEFIEIRKNSKINNFSNKNQYFQINKEFLVRELANTDPFDGPEPKPQFPGAHSLKGIPSWLINEKKKGRLSHGRINELREEYR